MLLAHGVTDRGRIRPTNEDCFGIDPDLDLLVVADGMGGHNAGEVASQMAVHAMLGYIRQSPEIAGLWPFGYDPELSEEGNLLSTAVQIANQEILETAGTAHRYTGMGTTIVAAMARRGRLTVAHVGDSRLYLRVDGGLRLLTRDHSWMSAMLAENPGADEATLREHPMRHALTRVVGARARTEVSVSEEILTGGEVLVLTTDGVHGVLDARRLTATLGEGSDAEEAATGLVAAAIAQGSRDNCTAVVAQYVAD